MRALRDKPPCEVCRVLRKLEGREPDCDNCLPPLLPDNEDVVRVFNVVQGQVVTAGQGKVVDINHAAIHHAIRIYKVVDKKDCFERVTWLFHELLSEVGE